MEAESSIFIGRSGCGKGTQAKRTQSFFEKEDPTRSVFYLQTGEEFRSYIHGTTPTQKIAKAIYDVGGLMPEFLTVYMWARALSDRFQGSEHLIIDGSPRKLHEAGALHSIFSFYKRAKPHVFYINISKDSAAKRLIARKRIDDTPEDIEARLGWFESEVMPAVLFYENNPDYFFHEIDGEKNPDQVWQDIEAVLKTLHA